MLTKFLLLSDKPQDLRDFRSLFEYILARVEWDRDLHVLSQTAFDTLDYASGKINHGSKAVLMEPSQPFGDAPCPHCGCLLRFELLEDGFRVAVATAGSIGAAAIVRRSMYLCPHCKTPMPYGTQTEAPPDFCPECQRRLYIPTMVENRTLGGAPKVTQHVVTPRKRGLRALLTFLRMLRLTSRCS